MIPFSWRQRGRHQIAKLPGNCCTALRPLLCGGSSAFMTAFFRGNYGAADTRLMKMHDDPPRTGQDDHATSMQLCGLHYQQALSLTGAIMPDARQRCNTQSVLTMQDAGHRTLFRRTLQTQDGGPHPLHPDCPLKPHHTAPPPSQMRTSSVCLVALEEDNTGGSAFNVICVLGYARGQVPFAHPQSTSPPSSVCNPRGNCNGPSQGLVGSESDHDMMRPLTLPLPSPRVK